MNYLSNLRLTFYWIKGHTWVFIKNAAFTHKDLWKRMCEVVRRLGTRGARSELWRFRTQVDYLFYICPSDMAAGHLGFSTVLIANLLTLPAKVDTTNLTGSGTLSSQAHEGCTAQLIGSWRGHLMCLVAVSGRTVGPFQAEASIGGWPSTALLPCGSDLGSTCWMTACPISQIPEWFGGAVSSTGPCWTWSFSKK